jgi:hypothetical protein
LGEVVKLRRFHNHGSYLGRDPREKHSAEQTTGKRKHLGYEVRAGIHEANGEQPGARLNLIPHHEMRRVRHPWKNQELHPPGGVW